MVCAVFALTGEVVVATAQGVSGVLSTVDTIQGRVINRDSLPSYGALVVITPERGGESKMAMADRNGSYTIYFPGRSGAYLITIRALGFEPAIFRVARAGNQGILIINSVLKDVAELKAVQVSRKRPSANGPNMPPREFVEPATRSDDMADPWKHTNPALYSVLGMNSTDNRISVNGMTVDAVLPMSGRAGSGFVVNTSDPSAGGFGGGLMKYRTNATASTFHEYVAHILLAPAGLQWTDAMSRIGGGQQTTANGALVFSNPLWGSPLRGSWLRHNTTISVARSQSPLPQLPTSVAGLAQYGLVSDSVQRFMHLVQRLGITETIRARPSNQENQHVAFITRFDGGGEQDSGFVYNLVLNAGQSTRSLVGSPLVLATHDGVARRSGGFAIGSMSRPIGAGALLTLNGSFNRFTDRTEPYTIVPEGRVRIGDSSVTWMTFGGNPTLGRRNDIMSWETKGAIKWRSMNGSHLFEVGGGALHTRNRIADVVNRGSFEFHSLEELEAGRASRFTRVTSASEQHTASTSFSLYGSDTWNPVSNLSIRYGVRVDGYRAGIRSVYNAAIDTAFGRRTDFMPRLFPSISPRIGLTRLYGWKGALRPGTRINSVSLNVGRYQSTVSPTELASFARATGLPTSSRSLECVGDAVPIAQWDMYNADVSNIPSVCADGSGEQALRSNAPYVRLFDSGNRPITRWSADLTWLNHRVISFTAGIFYNHFTQNSIIDLNLQRVPQFVLSSEGNRPVYASADAIVPATGAATTETGRMFPQFGPVLLSTSDVTGQVTSLVIAKRFALPFRFSMNAAYRHQQGSGYLRGFDDLTAGDPFMPTKSALAIIRHQVSLGIQWQRMRILDELETTAFVVNLYTRLQSGVRYTPRIAQDVNMDGRANDIAFVFDPATASNQQVSDGMLSVLQHAPRSARECLTRQIGTIATRNSCIGPWSVSADLEAAYTLPRINSPRLQINVLNAAGAFDQLLHGSQRRGWGNPVIADPTLLFVDGFDPATREFRYQVNRRFGKRSNVIHMPFSVQIYVSIPIGPSTASQSDKQYGRMIRSARNRDRDVFQSSVANLYQNPFETLIQVRETLNLTSAQDTLIRAAETAWLQKIDSLRTDLNRVVNPTDGDLSDAQLTLAVRRTRRAIAVLTLERIQTLQREIQLSRSQIGMLDRSMRYWFTGRWEEGE